MKLVECVPNISEGRNRKIIDAVAAEAETVEGVRLLDVDPGAATNRTVITFVGPPEAASEAAFRIIRKAADLIDMRQQKGEHPRNGATDVCPFVPLAGSTMDECVDLARRLGARVGSELGIPVYFYEHAATRPEWRNLANIRQGGYEALKDKLGTAEWKPDEGPNAWSEAVARTGATQVGARQFLVAYNVNLNTRQTAIARRIGMLIREQGGAVVKDDKGNKVRGPDGQLRKQDKGLFEHCKATGWFIEEYGVAQVTMNLTDYRVTSPHAVFDTVCRLANEAGCRVTGSEIVGLVPLEAMLAAGRHYLAKQGASAGVPESDLIDAARRSLGLDQVAKFVPEERIIEYRVASKRPLVSRTVAGFVDELSRDSAAPGGGSVAALCGALSAGLSAMVANLTVGKKGYEGAQAEMMRVAAAGQWEKDALVRAVDDDTFAFMKVMAALGLPKATKDQAAARSSALLDAQKEATLVPLSVLAAIPGAIDLAAAVAERGNANSLSDAGVAVLTARTGALGAYYNVLINLPGIEDAAFVGEIRSRAEGLVRSVTARCDELDSRIVGRLRAALDKTPS